MNPLKILLLNLINVAFFFHRVSIHKGFIEVQFENVQLRNLVKIIVSFFCRLNPGISLFIIACFFSICVDSKNVSFRRRVQSNHIYCQSELESMILS